MRLVDALAGSTDPSFAAEPSELEDAPYGRELLQNGGFELGSLQGWADDGLPCELSMGDSLIGAAEGEGEAEESEVCSRWKLRLKSLSKAERSRLRRHEEKKRNEMRRAAKAAGEAHRRRKEEGAEGPSPEELELKQMREQHAAAWEAMLRAWCEEARTSARPRTWPQTPRRRPLWPHRRVPSLRASGSA